MFSRRGRKVISFHDKSGISLNSMKIIEIHENLKNMWYYRNREKRKTRLGGKRGPDPAPLGAPFYYIQVR